jgi:uncharacterized protein YjbJ (UPF0337 family)
MDKDQVKGRRKQAEGAFEKAAGKIAGHKDMERSGRFKNAVGRVQSWYGNLRETIRKSK